LRFGNPQKLVHLAANGVGIGQIAQITGDLAHHVFVTGLFEIRRDDFPCIGIGILAGFAQKLRGPQTQQLVAAGFGLEFHFLIMGELVFECGLAIIECGHWVIPLAQR
jgi:hypothetical protein